VKSRLAALALGPPSLLFSLVVLAGCAGRPPQPARLALDQFLAIGQPALVDLVRVMEVSSNRERRDILTRILVHRDIAHQRLPYTAGASMGENIVLEIGRGPRTVIFTAHHDAAPGSPGANDNASCIASILAAYERLRGDPPRSLTARFIIFDGEERTREGSRAYVKGRDVGDVLGVYSYELCGIGTRINLWDVVTPELAEALIFTTLIDVLERAGLPYAVRGYVGQSSDHSSFRALDPPIPGFALTMLPEGVFAQLRPFRYYHRPTDLAATLDEGAMRTMADVIVLTVRALDRT